MCSKGFDMIASLFGVAVEAEQEVRLHVHLVSYKFLQHNRHLSPPTYFDNCSFA